MTAPAAAIASADSPPMEPAASPPQEPRRRPPRHSLAIVCMVLFMLSASHVLLYDYIGIRAIVQIVFGGAVIVLLGPTVLRQVYAGRYSLFALLSLSYIVVDFIWRRNIKDIVGYAVAFFLIMAASGFSTFRLNYFARIVAVVLAAFSLAGFLQVLLVMMNPSLVPLIMKGFDAGYYGKFHFTSPVEWLGGADSATVLFGIPFPRFVSYLEQASTVPAYFLLPAAIVLISGYRNKRLAYLPIVFSILSLGGSVTFCLGSSVIMFFIGRRLPRAILTIMPVVMLVAYAIGATLVLRAAHIDDTLFQIDQSPAAATGEGGGAEQYSLNRANSGFVRAVLFVKAIHAVRDSPVFGMSDSKDEIFSSLALTSGMRAGLLGVTLALLAFTMLFRRLGRAIKLATHDRHVQYGLCLLYAAAAQSVVYNDYGFSKFWGLTMFGVAVAMLQRMPNLGATTVAVASEPAPA